MEGTDVQVQLIFNETTSEPLPSNEDVVETLKTEVNNPNSTLMNDFNLTVVADSIKLIRVANVSTTPVPAATTITAVTAAPTIATTVTPTATVQIEFTSRETFVPELSDQNSEAFKARSKLTREQLQPPVESPV
ncbi:hypothetical protein JZ751_003820 [Albula glossodonta]|uniref:Uncharacterized protein n=1 Tax=Albula glossodonta TaxID=121402 RepID=A0A8T2P5H1_9TELE|nr:hypothetical protein JZ751_003820 [Albula glossodonta]